MSAQHVFVETNWVVDLVAPALSRNPGAGELLERSRRREVILHVPAIALSEAHKVVRERSLRADLENIRAFVRDTRDAGTIDEATANATFDLAILAAVLVRGEALHAAGNQVAFCTLDAHLQPWDRNGAPKKELMDLLDAAGVWVYGDFALEAPVRR